ncbi:MAG: YDG domain-containing protein [Candidatus Symbiothrix sp.]|nr:YDG domain-containing protein [Candidatus Symbiothrix sp.]
MKNLFIVVLMAFFWALPDMISAQNVTPVPPEFQRNTLYGVKANEAFRYNDPQTSATTTSLYSTTTTGAAWGTEALSTMAVGPWDDDANPNTPDILVAYHWYWGSSATLRRVSPYKTAVEFVVLLPLPGAPAYNYWSGGEVNQLTGEIYFTSGELSTLPSNAAESDGSFRMMKYNPYTGLSLISGPLKAKTTSDRTDVANHRPYSDMATDADGNAYILVRSNESFGAARRDWLLKVEIPQGYNTQETWYYSKVKEIKGLDLTYCYGLAFHRGKLYALQNTGVLWEIDPLSGQVTNKGASGTGYWLDLASANTASVIRGKVYNDADGDGIISGTEKTANGVPNVTIEIYDRNKTCIGNTQTNGSGEYSFLTNDPSGTYYIRVKRPKIRVGAGALAQDSIKAVQTWASAGTVTNAKSQFTVTAYTTDGTTNEMPLTNSGACFGARYGTDPNTQNLNDALFFSKIEMQDELIVGVVNFGLTAISDFGDAPDTAPNAFFAGTTLTKGGPAHLTHRNLFYLGADVSYEADGQPTAGAGSLAGADADTFDDGVTVMINGVEMPLQNVYLEADTTYTFKVKTVSPSWASAYLSGWFSYRVAGSGTVAPISTQIVTNQQPDASGNIQFSYTMPAYTGNNYGAYQAYFRFRFSNVSGLNAIANPDPGTGANYWGIYGEVEDYGIRLRRRYAPNITWPAVGSLTYGQALSAAGLTGGSSTPSGTFAFIDGATTYPKVSDSGTTQYTLLFLPTDTNAYLPVSQQKTVIVNRKTLIVSAYTVANKFYDGTNAALIKSVTFDGLVTGDVLTRGTDYTVTGVFGNTAVGTHPTSVISITMSTLSTATGNNYTAVLPNIHLSANILDAPLGDGTTLSQGATPTVTPAYSSLYLDSESKGLRLPRLSSNTRDLLSANFGTTGGPVAAGGLMIYNTNDAGIQFWNGTVWKNIDGTPTTTGTGVAAIRTPGAMFIGSTEQPDYFALLELESDKQGLRLPQISNDVSDLLEQLVSGDDKANGLLVFNAEANNIQYWDGTQWKVFTGTDVTPTTPSGAMPVDYGVNIGELIQPHIFALLEVTSLEKGIRLPQLSAATRNGLLVGATTEEQAAAVGLLIFNTDTKKLEYYNGTSWYSF